MEWINKAKNAVKSVMNKIKKGIKFFTSIIGQIVGWIILIVLLIILIVVAVQTVADWIKDLLGMDTTGIDVNSQDYMILESLTEAGYNSLMPADELAAYMDFEYAVLMDIAGCLENAGAYEGAYKGQSNLTSWSESMYQSAAKAALEGTQPDAADANTAPPAAAAANVADTAKAATLNKTGLATSTYERVIETRLALAGYATQSAAAGGGMTAAQQQSDFYGNMETHKTAILSELQGIGLSQSEAESIFNTAKENYWKASTGGTFSTELADEEKTAEAEVYYTNTFNQATGDTVLTPYLKVDRFDREWIYYVNSNGETFYEPIEYKPALNRKTQHSIKGKIPGSRVEGKMSADSSSITDKTTLGSKEDGFAQVLFKTNAGNDAEVTYMIPIKTLVDRYLPRATLLSTWYMLKADENATLNIDAVIQQIKDIYNEACGSVNDSKSCVEFERFDIESNFMKGWVNYTDSSSGSGTTGSTGGTSGNNSAGSTPSGTGTNQNSDEPLKFFDNWYTGYTIQIQRPTGIDPESYEFLKAVMIREELANTHSDSIESVLAEELPEYQDGTIEGEILGTAGQSYVDPDRQVVTNPDGTKRVVEKKITYTATYDDKTYVLPEDPYQVNTNFYVFKDAEGKILVNGSEDMVEELRTELIAKYTETFDRIETYTEDERVFGFKNEDGDFVSNEEKAKLSPTEQKQYDIQTSKIMPVPKTKVVPVTLPAKVEIIPHEVLTVKEETINYTQNIRQRKMPIYLVKKLEVWNKAAVFQNVVTQDRFIENKRYILSANKYGRGMSFINVEEKFANRLDIYEPVFKLVRERGVLSMFLQWEDIAEKGDTTAYSYIREVYKIIYQLKLNGILNESAYAFIYVPKEVIQFEDVDAQEIFWMQAYGVTNDDPLALEEMKMRNKRNIVSWQVVDYDVFEECDGKVYALFPLGSPYVRSLYMSEAMLSPEGGKKVGSWGWFTGGHQGADLYGRTHMDDMRSYDSKNAHKGVYFKSGAVGLVGKYANLQYSQQYGADGAKKLEEDIWNASSQGKLSPIVAVAPGYVIDCRYSSTSGFRVKIQHEKGKGDGEGVVTAYFHMRRWPEVEVGDYVGAGTVIGYEGTTGASRGVHLHFEVQVNGVPEDPITYLFPFFNPFFYSQKAAENGLNTEYWSLIRTVIVPEDQLDAIGANYGGNYEYKGYGSIPSTTISGAPLNGSFYNGSVENFVPSTPLLDSTDRLVTRDDVPAYQIPISTEVAPEVNYSGEDLSSSPDWFDADFIAGVMANQTYSHSGTHYGKINGAKRGNGSALITSGSTLGAPVGGFTSAGWKYNWSREKEEMKGNAITAEDWRDYELESASQIKAAGGEGTRGAVVAAARFLCGFPYKIVYTGRPQDSSKNIAYYNHIGLNRTWGTAVEGHAQNGLDCAAFASWVLINAGVRGENQAVSNEFWANESNTKPINQIADQIKPGDIIHTRADNPTDKDKYTHIGIVIGVDEDNIYVAESQTVDYTGESVYALVLTVYPKDYSGKCGWVTLCDSKYDNLNGEGRYTMELPDYEP